MPTAVSGGNVSGFNGTIYTDDSFGQTSAYNLSGVLQWAETDLAQYQLSQASTATAFYFRLGKLLAANGAFQWQAASPGVAGADDPQQVAFDAVNSQLVSADKYAGSFGGEVRANADSNGSSNWITTIESDTEQLVLDNGVIFVPLRERSLVNQV